MIDPSTRGAWIDLDAKLRPFVARRVRGQADVDDVMQDVFLRMQRGLRDLRDDERFGPWVYRVARSAVVDHQRRLRRTPLSESADIAVLSERGEDASTSEQELAAHLATFIARLASPYREALTLTELEGLTQAEAAAMLDISLSGMKSRVQRARRQLKNMLEACCAIAVDARGRVMECEPRRDGPLPDCRCR